MVMVDGCHTDKVYLQPIKEIKFLDDWAEKFIPANVTGIIMAYNKLKTLNRLKYIYIFGQEIYSVII